MVSRLVIAALLAACGSSRPPLERVGLGPEHRGLSGLTRDGSGMLWAPSEHADLLVRFAADGSRQATVPIRGLPGGLDVESIAWLGGDRFALGTESRDGGATELVAIVEIGGGAVATVVDQIAVSAGRVTPGNQGIEGLCAAGGTLLAAFETPIESGGARSARLVRIDLATREQRPTAVTLTSATGKISGLDCRRRGAGLEVLAIERHFEVVRVLRFTIPDRGAPGAPAIAADLEGLRLPRDNPEGIVADGGHALVILDNDYGGVTGPTELLRIPL